ncbi:MAG: putative ABC transport system permease protein [Rhodothermales bacterium]|jgi:putative ABC transport system permease protein
MRALHRKLLRDTWKHRGQVVSIASVVAVGIMTVLTMRGSYASLEESRDRYYTDSRMPDVWASLERAPESVRRKLEDIPGLSNVSTRVAFAATLDIPTAEAPAIGRFFSIPEDRSNVLSDIHITSGRYIAPGRQDEAVVSKNFALANRYEPGDTLRAVINGRLRDLLIVGTAISPEHTYAIPPGALYPDNERYGIVWMGRDILGAAYNIRGGFNEVMATFSPGADEARVLDAIDDVLIPYGGLGAYLREDQPSHAMVQSELDQGRSMGLVVPVVFMLVAAFLLNIVLGRMIATERTEIAVLKAFGYSNWTVGLHYLRFAMIAVFLGTGLGTVAGIRLGGSMVELYAEFFDFPDLRYTMEWSMLSLAIGLSTLAAGLGAVTAVRKAVRLPPAEAMRPEPPARFKPGLLERSGLTTLLPTAGRMILRNLERKSVLSVPTSALFQLEGTWQVFQVKDGVAVLAAVRIGHRSTDSAEILEGLSSGDQVILFPSDKIEAGVKVKS